MPITGEELYSHIIDEHLITSDVESICPICNDEVEDGVSKSGNDFRT